ncbi:hypothetical protein ACVI1N_001443 [Sinorhizobium medicae]
MSRPVGSPLTAVAFEISVEGIRRVGVDASAKKGLAVDHHGAPHAVEKRDRPIGHHGIQPVPPGNEACLPESITHEILPVDPFAVGISGGVGQNRVAHLIGRRIDETDVEILGIAGREREVGMCVHIVEARHGKTPAQVRDFGLSTDQMLHVRALAARYDTPTRDRQSPTPGQAGIPCIDLAVGEYEVGLSAAGRVAWTMIVKRAHGRLPA